MRFPIPKHTHHTAPHHTTPVFDTPHSLHSNHPCTMFKVLIALVAAAAAVVAAPVEQMEERITHTGQATYFAVGLGACGWTNSDSDFIVALNSPQYTAQNGANCGQWLTITNEQNGNTAQAYVADECPGCADGSLDMSPSLFSQLANGNMDEGVFPISWHFNKRS